MKHKRYFPINALEETNNLYMKRPLHKIFICAAVHLLCSIQRPPLKSATKCTITPFPQFCGYKAICVCVPCRIISTSEICFSLSSLQYHLQRVMTFIIYQHYLPLLKSKTWYALRFLRLSVQ